MGFSIKDVKFIVLIVYNTGDGTWSEPELIAPNEKTKNGIVDYINNKSAALNYSFGGFEGEKARRSRRDKNLILMPTLNWNWLRFRKLLNFFETEIVSLPNYKKAHELLIKAHKDIIPNYPEEYYIRPVFALGQQLGMKLQEDTDRVIAIFGTPVSGYYDTEIKVMALTDQLRCMPGGTGCIKASCNYPHSMHGQRKARRFGFDDALFLDETLIDPHKAGSNNPYRDNIHDIAKCNIQECAVSNICFIKNGILYSPEERDTILPSTTKRHIFDIAIEMGILVMRDRPIALDQFVLADEAFACGTAAFITPIIGVGAMDRYFKINNEKPGKITQEIKKELSKIYWGEKDPFNWMFKIKL